MAGNRHSREVADCSLSRETETSVMKTQQRTWSQRSWRGKQDQRRYKFTNFRKAVRD